MKNSSLVGGLGTVLQIIFIVLKIVGIIDWSWFVVFLPTIIPIALVIAVLFIIFLIAVATAAKK